MAYENLATILTCLNSTDEGLGPKSLETELIGTLSLGRGGEGHEEWVRVGSRPQPFGARWES